MASLYWIDEALRGMLPVLWMFIGVGLPWALAVVPAKQWHSRAMLGAVALALGPAWMTAWMLVLGVIGAQLNQRLFTPAWILSGSVVIMLVGLMLAWRKRKHYTQKTSQSPPLAIDEKLIIGLIVLAVVIRWLHTAFWTFTAYDALWVYGFQGRLYFLEGFIPNTIDYYPQFVQLQYSYVQVLIGEINDYAARMVIPMMHIGSILAAYLLGERLLNRRVGLTTAALWSLHPYVGQWSFIGDLEIPVTFSFTIASAFFLTAWMEKDDAVPRRQYAVLAGLMLGIAMYTKPTAGAFIWGVVLLVVVDLVRVRLNIRQWLPRFKVAFWTGLMSIPLGAVWYVRNILLGHDVITLPPEQWLSLARRSADHFNWIALAVIIGFIVCSLIYNMPRRRFIVGSIGIALLLIGTLLSNPTLFPQRFDPPQSYITLFEAILIVIGFIIVASTLLPYIRRQLDEGSNTLHIVAWALLLALPYFATWFYSYSYHYRLGFAIVPLIILPTAIFLSKWLTIERIQDWSRGRCVGYLIMLFVLCVPGVVSVAVDVTWSQLWLFNNKLNSGLSKYQVFNPSLIEIVYAFNEYQDANEDEPIIVAPGEQRLHFFFPQLPIVDATLQTLNEFEAIGATHFLYGTQARWAYERAGIEPRETQLISALGRPDRFEEVKHHNEATFSYELYQYFLKPRRASKPKSRDYPVLYNDVDIIFGNSLRFLAEGVSPMQIFEGENILLSYAWEALQPIHTDYLFIVDLYNRDTKTVGYQWTLHFAPHRYGDYSPTLWDVSEYVADEQSIRVPTTSKIKNGDNYEMRLRVLDPVRNQYLPVYINSQIVGDFLPIGGTFQVGG